MIPKRTVNTELTTQCAGAYGALPTISCHWGSATHSCMAAISFHAVLDVETSHVSDDRLAAAAR